MSSSTFSVVVGLLLVTTAICYGFLIGHWVRASYGRVRRNAASSMRKRAVELVRYYGDVSSPNYRTIYDNLAQRLSELPLE